MIQLKETMHKYEIQNTEYSAYYINAHIFVGSLPEAKANCGFLCGQHQMAAHGKKHSRLIGMMTMAMVMMITITIINVKLFHMLNYLNFKSILLFQSLFIQIIYQYF